MSSLFCGCFLTDDKSNFFSMSNLVLLGGWLWMQTDSSMKMTMELLILLIIVVSLASRRDITVISTMFLSLQKKVYSACKHANAEGKVLFILNKRLLIWKKNPTSWIISSWFHAHDLVNIMTCFYSSGELDSKLYIMTYNQDHLASSDSGEMSICNFFLNLKDGPGCL